MQINLMHGTLDDILVVLNSLLGAYVNPLDTSHTIHRSLSTTICIFLTLNGGSTLQHFADIPTAYSNFQVLSSVTAYFKI